MDKPKLSVVIPAYKETTNIKNGCLNQVYDYLRKQDYTWEVLVVDDDSPDDTLAVARENIKGKKGFQVIHETHGGKGITVMRGVLQAKGEIILATDMDQATPIEQLEKLLPKFEEGYDIVIGSRSGRKGAPLIRKIYAFGFVMLRNVVLGLPFKDTQCGFKAYTQEAARGVFPQMLAQWEKKTSSGAAVNAGFDIEALFLAKKKGLKVAEVPVTWQYVQSERVGIGAAIEALKDMVRIRLNDLRGGYDQFLQAA